MQAFDDNRAIYTCVAAELTHFVPQEENFQISRPSRRGPLQDFFLGNVLVGERKDAGKKLPAGAARNLNDL